MEFDVGVNHRMKMKGQKLDKYRNFVRERKRWRIWRWYKGIVKYKCDSDYSFFSRFLGSVLEPQKMEKKMPEMDPEE